MSTPVFSPAAQADIEDIYDYTLQKWSLEQAEKYIRALGLYCNDLGTGKRKGRDASLIRAGYRKQPCGSHIIFFKSGKAAQIEIIRVLHQRMDVERHL